MEHLTPKIIAKITGGDYIGAKDSQDTKISGAAKDNREVKTGNLFVCIRGERADGHDFANKAFEAGAACCLAETMIPDAIGPYVIVTSTLEAIKQIGAYHRSLFTKPVIGITGSVGKTTTKEMVAAVLETKLKTLKTKENMNNELGVPLTLLSLDETYDAAVIEMGISDFGEMNRLAEMVKPDICIITKIGYSHLSTLGDLEGVLRAKTEVFKHMSPDGIAIFNGDDDLLWDFDPGIRKITYGVYERCDFYAEFVSGDGITSSVYSIKDENSTFSVEIRSYGLHIIHAALAATVTAGLLSLSNADIAQGILSHATIWGRANLIDTGYLLLIDDCYNANPDSVVSALSSSQGMSRRRVAILGDMLDLGDSSEERHRYIGGFAAFVGIDLLICCGKNAKNIYDGYISRKGEMAYYYADKTELIASLPQLIKKDDAVLVKASHGMKFEELLPVILRFQG